MVRKSGKIGKSTKLGNIKTFT